jgi:hypothetical protein
MERVYGGAEEDRGSIVIELLPFVANLSGPAGLVLQGACCVRHCLLA